jgi:hypothetical protein
MHLHHGICGEQLMYYNEDMTHRVDWNPQNEDVAYQPIIESQHPEISSISEAKT